MPTLPTSPDMIALLALHKQLEAEAAMPELECALGPIRKPEDLADALQGCSPDELSALSTHLPEHLCESVFLYSRSASFPGTINAHDAEA